MEQSEKARDILMKIGQLREARTHFEQIWDDIRTYVITDSPPIYGGTDEPDFISTKNYDSTATLALRNIASVMMSSVTSPNTKWVRFRDSEFYLNNEFDDDEKEWFAAVENIVEEAFENSNAYPKLHENYTNMAGFGTGIMYLEEGEGDIDLNFRTIHIGNVYLVENSYGRIDTVYREVIMDARSVVEKFGYDNVSEGVQKMLERNPYQEVGIIHGVYPRKDRIYSDDTGEPLENILNAPYEECWIEADSGHLLSESGYRTFPFIVTRFKTQGNYSYGSSPVFQAMPDIRTLNRMEKARLELAEKLTNPPKLYKNIDEQRINLAPGGQNFVDSDASVEDLINVQGSYPVNEAAIAEKRKAVQSAMFQDQLQLIDKDRMTVEEVTQRRLENLRILSPVISRTGFELLNPMIARTLDILERRGRLPEMPASLLEKGIKLKFTNQLARSQKQDEIRALDYAVRKSVELSNALPEKPASDYIDSDKVFFYLMDQISAPVEILRNKAQVRKIREDRARMQDEQRQIAMAERAAEIGETRAKATERNARAAKNQRE